MAEGRKDDAEERGARSPDHGAAQGAVLAADLAQSWASAGAVTLIDIRTPQEWAQTGRPAGAMPLALQDPAFGETLLDLIQNAETPAVALICATGGRTGHVSAQLRQMGLSGFYDVSEGMMGSEAGPGWLARGLPVERDD